MVLELARVADVTEVRAGSELSSDHVAGAKVLSVYLTMDYNDQGGEVEIAGDVYDYDTMDEETSTVTLTNGLLADVPADTEVWVYPESWTKLASVEIDEEPDEARIPHNLIGSIEAMVRDGYDQESVVLEQQGNTWVIKDVIAEEYKLSGEYIPTETLPLPEVPPATVNPLFTLTEGPACIIVEWDNVPQQVDVHMSIDGVPGLTGNEDPPGPETLLMEDVVSPLWIYKDHIGVPIGTRMPFITLHASGAPMPTDVDYIQGAAGTIPDEYLTFLAGVVIAQRLLGEEVVGAKLTGGELDIAGSIHAYPGYLDIIADQLTAKAATFNDNLTILGQNNKLAGGMELGTGVSNPTSKVTVTSADWTTVTYPGVLTRNLWGFTDSPDGTEHWAISNGITGTNCDLYRIRKTDGVVLGTYKIPGMPRSGTSAFIPMGGCTRIGNNLYVLGQDLTRSSDYYVYIYDVTVPVNINKTGEWRFGNFSSKPHIGVYNGEIIIAWMNNTPNLRWRTYTPATGVETLNITGTTLYPSRRDIWSVDQYGSANVCVLIEGYSPGGYNIDQTVRDTTLDFVLPGISEYFGLYFDGIRPHVLGLDKTWSGSRHPGGTYDYAWTQVDGDPAGLGVAETMASSLLTTASVPRFKRPVITHPAPTFDGTTDGANTGAIYAAPAGQPLRRQFGLGTNLNVNNAGPAVGGELTAAQNKTLTLDRIDTTGTLPAPPFSNGFAARLTTAPGYFWSTPTSPDGRKLIDVRGDGLQPRIRNLRHTVPHFMGYRSAATLTVTPSTPTRLNFNTTVSTDGVTVTNSGGTWTIQRAGLYQVKCQVRAANEVATGRREIRIQKNGIENGTVAKGSAEWNTSGACLEIVKVLKCEVGDVVECMFWQNSSGNITVTGGNDADTLGSIHYLGEAA